MKPTDALPHPSDWQESSIGRTIEIKRGISWSKEQEHSTHRDGAVPVIRIGNVQSTLELDDMLYISGLKSKAVEKKRVGGGWSILVGSNGNRARIGNAVLIREKVDFLFASFLLGARPEKDAGFSSEWFYRWLGTERVQAYLTASAEGSTGLSNLSHSFFRSLTIAFPPTDAEQVAITRVLDAVDIAIERARSAVDSAAKLRLSLMQAAFTFEFTASKARKESGIGMIPAEWEVVKGKQCFTILTGGNSSVDALRIGRSDSFNAWFMKVDDFNNPANRWGIQVTKIGFEAKRNPSFRLLPLQTVIISKRGAAILKNRVRTTKAPIALDPNLMALQPAPDVLPDFLKYQLEWRNLSRYVESSGVPQLNNKDLYPRLFLKAPESEQKQIIELIEAAERKQEAIGTRLIILEQLKKSLMHDLLTGKVRVPIYLTESEPTMPPQPQL